MRALALGLALAGCVSPLDPSAPAWQRVAQPAPTARWGHAAVEDAAGDRMLVFGGQTASGETADVWSFEFSSQLWSQLVTSAGPAPRVNPGLVLDAARHRLVTFGGRTGTATYFADAWALDLQTLQWTSLPVGPPGRQRPHAATDGATAWFYGGEGLFSVFGDLWAYDLLADAWSELPMTGNGPGARTCGGFTSAGKALYMVMGHDVEVPRGGTFRYDLGAQQWSAVSTSGGTAASAHWAYALDAACGAVFLSGGDHMDNYDTSLTDAFSPGTGAFARLPASSLPPPNDHASLVVDSRRHELVLYGGTVGDGESFLGDTWTYALPSCP